MITATVKKMDLKKCLVCTSSCVSSKEDQRRIQFPKRVRTMKYTEDHMPDFTPPWERMPLYITSFQSSPVRICDEDTPTAAHCHTNVTDGSLPGVSYELGCKSMFSCTGGAVRGNPLTDLKDGHDSGRKGVKVCGSVVFKDEPVKQTQHGRFSEVRLASSLFFMCISLMPSVFPNLERVAVWQQNQSAI